MNVREPFMKKLLSYLHTHSAPATPKPAPFIIWLYRYLLPRVGTSPPRPRALAARPIRFGTLSSFLFTINAIGFLCFLFLPQSAPRSPPQTQSHTVTVTCTCQPHHLLPEPRLDQKYGIKTHTHNNGKRSWISSSYLEACRSSGTRRGDPWRAARLWETIASCRHHYKPPDRRGRC